jgi:hypothetical protein
MPLTSDPPPQLQIDAAAYRRAHAGKLMIIPRKEREPLAQDFFYLDSVGTHPTGLIVTGLFGDATRHHMMASTVREATEREIAWKSAITAGVQEVKQD